MARDKSSAGPNITCGRYGVKAIMKDETAQAQSPMAAAARVPRACISRGMKGETTAVARGYAAKVAPKNVAESTLPCGDVGRKGTMTVTPANTMKLIPKQPRSWDSAVLSMSSS
eukprot:1484013-Prymnesium_polylepis.1